ncbi:MAG TPA: response regulator [Pirellulales bacterium]|nr:response regulator [Pirellulales bacterium]
MTKNKLVLIADDDENVVDVVARRCEALGLRVERAYDGKSAIEKAMTYEADLIVLDVNMPGGSGLTVCEMLSRDAHLKSSPVIMLTGRKDAQTVRSCNDLLAYYVPKGADMWARLEPVMEELLDLGRGRTAHPSQDVLCVGDVIVAAATGRNCEDQTGGPLPDGELAPAWVLCVDDDREFVESLKWRLGQHGVEVAQAFAGMAGYRAAFTTRAGAILLDQDMPDGNGEYILRRLKENIVTRDIPVLVVTGSRDRMLERKMYNLGAAGYFTKPVVWDELWSKLRCYLDVRSDKSAPVLQAAEE